MKILQLVKYHVFFKLLTILPNGRPILPKAIHLLFEYIKLFSINFVVVDFPFVPVTPIRKFFLSAKF